ncbi:hypothetical protein HF325_000233 [Metschnikowia pulcherrima]|uniref:rRNA methyltransferase 1, mitochondrial n=1 Tax=Metschnikowia pulcherrima TaxID=27326 RepID=A0A8H7GYU8_9ASCO|nr:hypothetical protein HF325_000233 [Metschnikowia pulcherrima]
MIRSFHTSQIFRAIRPAFKPHDSRKGVRSFDKNFDSREAKDSVKIWDKKGISKHEFFIRKYGNISPEERKRLDEKVERQKYLREQRKKARARRRTSSRKILKLAKKYGVRIIEKKSKGELNTLSSNGVHNGVVLETKPLILPEITCLNTDFDGETGTYSVTLIDDLTHNKVSTDMDVVRPLESGAQKFPLGIFVDGVTDPQNLGNIVRSAYYLGADFLVMPESESARLGPVAAKAAAGALDLMTIYKTDSSLKFIDSSKANGWTVITTSSKESASDLEDINPKHRQHVTSKYIDQSELPNLMRVSPVLLVLGSEGEGVRANVKLRSDVLVGWKKGRHADDLVDSMNVGVAAGLMIAKCLE